MHTYQATVSWNKGDQNFSDNRYSRAHLWSFDGGAQVAASSSALSVPEPMSVTANVDPEEALIAATSSCHMLFFLSLAAQSGFVVENYVDHAVGVMEKNNEGKIAITRIMLRPAITFFAGRQPTADELAELHHRAHDECYIANSIKADVTVESI
jgi:organic hydroperoxide reductase OsmC/OhrA